MEKPKPTIEELTSQTILQLPERIKVGEKTYMTAPPSTATLILVSEAVSLLPQTELDKEQVASESLRIARHCRVLGDVVAILILGARGLKRVEKTRHEQRKRRLWGLLPDKVVSVEVEEEIDCKARLSKELLECLTPKQLNALTAKLLNMMNLADFFALTTFLLDTNMTRPTKVESETTASGR